MAPHIHLLLSFWISFTVGRLGKPVSARIQKLPIYFLHFQFKLASVGSRWIQWLPIYIFYFPFELASQSEGWGSLYLGWSFWNPGWNFRNPGWKIRGEKYEKSRWNPGRGKTVSPAWEILRLFLYPIFQSAVEFWHRHAGLQHPGFSIPQTARVQHSGFSIQGSSSARIQKLPIHFLHFQFELASQSEAWEFSGSPYTSFTFLLN